MKNIKNLKQIDGKLKKAGKFDNDVKILSEITGKSIEECETIIKSVLKAFSKK